MSDTRRWTQPNWTPEDWNRIAGDRPKVRSVKHQQCDRSGLKTPRRFSQRGPLPTYKIVRRMDAQDLREALREEG